METGLAGSTRTQISPDASEKDVTSRIRRMRPKNAQDACCVHIALPAETDFPQGYTLYASTVAVKRNGTGLFGLADSV